MPSAALLLLPLCQPLRKTSPVESSVLVVARFVVSIADLEKSYRTILLLYIVVQRIGAILYIVYLVRGRGRALTVHSPSLVPVRILTWSYPVSHMLLCYCTTSSPHHTTPPPRTNTAPDVNPHSYCTILLCCSVLTGTDTSTATYVLVPAPLTHQPWSRQKDPVGITVKTAIQSATPCSIIAILNLYLQTPHGTKNVLLLQGKHTYVMI